MVRRLVALVLLFAAFSAHALIPTVNEWRVSVDGGPVRIAADNSLAELTAACAAFSSQSGNWLAAGPPAYVSTATYAQSFCGTFRDGNFLSEGRNVYASLVSGVCPVNSTAVSGGCQCANGFSESGGQCSQNQCGAQTGKTGILSWTEGYTLTPDEGDRKTVGGYNAPPSNGEICQSGCMVSAQTSGAGVEYFVSQQPTAQGLYRRSADFPTVGLGTPCTASDSAANSPVAPEPQCPGTVGQVGNKTACLSTPSKPVPTGDAPATSKPPIAGNPAAGPKPESGAGSGNGSAGRTPDAGTGGNAGGSASAAVGGKGGGAGGTAAGTGTGTGTGSGTTGGNSSGSVAKGPEGTEQAACGAPGQPVCAVKVDENGTPQVGDTFKTANEAVDKGKTDTDQLREKAAGKDDKGFFEPFKDLFLTPPMAACEAIALPDRIGMSIDPCPVVDGVRSVMAWIWAAGGLWLCFGMIKRSI